MSNEQRESVIRGEIISGKRHGNGLLKFRELAQYKEMIGKTIADITESESGLLKIVFEDGAILDFHKEESGEILLCFDGDWDFLANVKGHVRRDEARPDLEAVEGLHDA
jgi:hypothetical protein